MFRLLFVGCWVGLVALGSTYGGAYWRQRQQNEAAGTAHAEKVEVRKARPLTVPIISGGALKGYVSAEFSFVEPAADGHAPHLDPESFFLDEAFRLIYAESKVDFTNIQKTDLDALTAQITARVNQRLGKTALKETLVRNLTFVAREDLPK